jgi:DNA polymerase
MASVLFGDFETRSACDLKVAGADVYARHPTTDVLCFGYAFDDEPVQLWRPGLPPPQRVLDHVRGGGQFVGHNSTFELLIWNHVMTTNYSWCPLAVSQVSCTMVRAYAMGLPGSLEMASTAVGIPEGKDIAGSRVMLYLAKPKAIYSATVACPDGIEWHDPLEEIEKFSILYDYCMRDVAVERELHKRLPALSEKEQRIYELDYRINQRGVRVDESAARSALRIVEHQQDRANLEVERITDGAVAAFTAIGQIADYCRARGFAVESLAKADVTELLERIDLSESVRRLLEIRKESSKSSTAKIKAMLQGLCPDGRVRGLFQYYGAGTGRWAGRRVQLQNLPRPKLSFEEIEAIFEILEQVA